MYMSGQLARGLKAIVFVSRPGDQGLGLGRESRWLRSCSRNFR